MATGLGQVGAELERRSYSAGTRIFKQGQAGRDAFFVESGKVEITREMNGRNILLGTIGRNELFGEMAILDETVRMATATALEKTTVVVISHQVIRAKLGGADAFVKALVRMLCSNLREVTDKLGNCLSRCED